MSCSKPRAGLLLLAALFFAIGAAAGELYRPVPSDAQVTRFTRFNIRYALRDIVANGVQKVEFYITEDMGRTWRLYGEDPDRTSPMTVEVPGEGVYGFVCIATDRFGNREREPGPRTRPETVIVVDRTPPTAKWLAPLQDVLGRSGAVELSWEANDANFGSGPVKLQYAMDARSNHDRDAVWNTLQETLSAKGSVNWTPPATSSGRYNFRLIAEDRAGNLAVAYNPATIIFDSTPPTITGVSPLRSNKLENDIIVEADDGSGGSGVKEISLYTSDNSGGTWTLVKETTDSGESVPVKRAPGQGIPFSAHASGAYGLWPVVFDEAGNATPLPSIGVVGPYVLTIDTEPPVVTLSSSFLQGMAAVLANETRRVEWTAYDPHLSQNSAVISLSLDNGNTWQELRSGMPSSGSEIVQFPFGSQSEEAKLRVRVSDDFGNVGEAVSESFKLARAGTTISEVTPVSSGSDGVAAGTPLSPWDDEPGIPPRISSPPGSPNPGLVVTYPPEQSIAPNYPFDTPPAPPADPLPPEPVGTGPLFGQPPPAAGLYPDQTPQPVVIPPAAIVPTPGAGESSALSLPQGMYGQGQRLTPPPTSAPPQTPPPAPQPATPSWTPSPGAGTGGTPPAQPFIPPATPDWGEPSPETPASAAQTPASPFDGDPDWTPPPAPPASQWEAPAASGGQTGTPGSAPATSPDWTSGSGAVAPPPLPGGTDSQLSLPALDGGLSLPSDQGSGFPEMPPLDTSSPLQLPSLDGSLPPLAAPGGASPAPTDAGQTALRPTPTPAPIVQPQQSATSPAPAPTRPESSLPPLAPVNDYEDQLQRPPSIAPQTQTRPSDPRGLSNHYADESTAYLNEGRLDLSLESGRKALEADQQNPRALMALSQVYAQDMEGINNFATAANLAKDATARSRTWDTWWNCADVFYRWSHKRNTEMQDMIRSNVRPPLDVTDERNQALNNARIAINNAATLLQQAQVDEADRKKVANTQGLIAYLAARAIPEPVNPGEAAGQAAMAQYRNEMASYKAAVTPALQEALPFFRAAMQLGGTPGYSESFHLGIINFRLGGLERDSGNLSQGLRYYEEAVRYLEEATTAKDTPAGGPREAYYMLANCYDLLADQAGPSRARYKELALRYWRQTATFYPVGSPYRDYSEQRIEALSRELGQ